MSSASRSRALELTFGHLTKGGIDRDRAVLAIQLGDPEAIATVKRGRRQWLDHLTEQQRRWQSNPRTVTPARIARRRHDWGDRHPVETVERALAESVRTREQYVRCAS